MSEAMTRVFQARWQSGYLSPEEIPDIAAQLMVAGADSLALRQLAGLLRPTAADVAPLMERVLLDFGSARMPRAEALRIVIEDVARRVVSGEMEPYAAAADLHGLWSDSGHTEYLAVFANALDEYDDFPEARAAITAEIVEAARRLLQVLDVPTGEVAVGEMRTPTAPE